MYWPLVGRATSFLQLVQHYVGDFPWHAKTYTCLVRSSVHMQTLPVGEVSVVNIYVTLPKLIFGSHVCANFSALYCQKEQQNFVRECTMDSRTMVVHELVLQIC